MSRDLHAFQTIRSEGGLLPTDLLRRVLDPKSKLEGTRPEDYGLPQSERLSEAITQSWNRLRKHWAEFRALAAGLPEGEAGTGLTNDRWSLPLLRELRFGPLQAGAGPEIDGRTYPISRFAGTAPVHLIGCGLSLDHRAAGKRGAAAVNPHGLVQEFLNRSPGHLWAVLSNGLRLRVLRDNQALSRQAFLEFDLETMFDGEVYSDFVLLWLMAHATRFAPHDSGRPDSCWLERWAKEAAEQGTRALGDLRGGVERALQILGEGFASHPKNSALRDALRSGRVAPADLHSQLLRVVYRLIFLFVAEDRTLDGQPLLHPSDNSDSARLARERYAAHYCTARLRELAGKIKGSRHGDLWRQFQMLVSPLSARPEFASMRERLALPALGSFLWDPDSTAALNDAELTNHDFLEALRHLAFTLQGKVLRLVDYKNIGAEELGGVYESLLSLTPQISADGARFTFAEFAGHERKMSGSYYTPDSLVQCLLNSALDPVVEEALKGKKGAEAEKAILGLKVCDPAVGSGHFLVGAAHRLAKHLARVRALAQGESEPSPLLYQNALRDVIGRCLYGVDINPMAAELCRVSLWLEALEPGKPLSFLDHHIRVGNSLIGATPELIASGVPDRAFKPIEGDDKEACAALKKRNKAEREGMGRLFAKQDAEILARLQRAISSIEELPDDRPEDILAKEQAFRRYEQTEGYRHRKLLADTWCAAFVIKKYFHEPGCESSASGITQNHLNDLAEGLPLSVELEKEVTETSKQYQFFHWHLEFPDIFSKGGFNCVIGNPPWEKINLKLEEYFALIRPEIARAATKALRTTLIRQLIEEAPREYEEYIATARIHDGLSHYFRASGAYPATGISRINLYSLFAERGGQLLSPEGRLGMLFPTGIATDQNNKDFFFGLAQDHRLVSVYDFENRIPYFPDVDSRFRFSLLVFSGAPVREAARFGFFLTSTSDISEPQKIFELTPVDLRLLSPESGTAPIFKSAHEAILARAIYRRHKTIAQWEARIGILQTPFNMANDSHLFIPHNTESTEPLLPLLEGKHIGPFNWRAARGENDDPEAVSSSPQRLLDDPEWYGVVRHYIREPIVQQRYPASFRLVYRKITNATNERTAIASLVPPVAIGDTLTQMSGGAKDWALFCVAGLNSFAFDFIARVRMSGTSLTQWIVRQIPMPEPMGVPDTAAKEFVDVRAIELSLNDYWILGVFQTTDWFGKPFRFDEERRFLLRCELDAAFFRLFMPAEKNGDWVPVANETDEDLTRLKVGFSTPRDAVNYIMDTFPIVRRKDKEKFGEYRTKRIILEIYDAMQEAVRTGQSYQTRLDPPPADPRCCHPPQNGVRVSNI